MTGTPPYSVPDGRLCLAGPVARPAPNTLPLRGDLAHIALAGKYLAAHYVVPQPRTIGPDGAIVFAAPRDDAEAVLELPAGAPFEALDFLGQWVWGCLGPDGPSGYLKGKCLTSADQ